MGQTLPPTLQQEPMLVVTLDLDFSPPELRENN